MQFDAALNGFTTLYTQYGSMLDAGLLILSRTLAFMQMGPIFNRKDVAFNVKIAFAIFLSITLLWIIPVENPKGFSTGQILPFLALIFMNITVGLTLGFISDLIMKTVSAAGSMMNNQIGLSSAITFDPSSRTQVMIIDRLFSFIGLMLFFHLGGAYWVIQALERSFDVFPLFSIYQDIANEISIKYVILISSNIIIIATQFVAPIIVVTMSIDLILGIVNRTAQQMPVFQLSFAMKPSIGVAVMLATLPIFLQSLKNFLTDFHLFY